MIDEKAIATVEELDRRYRETFAVLLERIAKRDEMKSLLRIAKPAQIVALRGVISRLDKTIESIEQQMEMIAEMQTQRLRFDKGIKEMDAMSEQLTPEFLDYIALHQRDKLDQMGFMISDEDASKAH